MLGFFILCGAALVALIVRFIWRRRLPQVPRTIRVAGVVLHASGAILTLESSQHLESVSASRRWPTVVGTVTHGDMADQGADAPATVTYEYAVRNSTYRGTTDLDAATFGTQDRQAAGRAVPDYPVGLPVTVHYNPSDPAQSVINVSVGWSVLGKLGLGVTIFLGGLLGLLLSSNRRRQFSS